jgi:transcription elongation factor Elf1
MNDADTSNCLPCPHCGGRPSVSTAQFGNNHFDIGCKHCGYTLDKDDTIGRCIRAWNKAVKNGKIQ